MSFKRLKDRDRLYDMMNKLWQTSKEAAGPSLETSINAGEVESAESSGEDEEVKGEDVEEQAPVQEDEFANLRDPTDQELHKALDQVPLPQGHKEMGRLVMPFKVEEFWDLF